MNENTLPVLLRLSLDIKWRKTFAKAAGSISSAYLMLNERVCTGSWSKIDPKIFDIFTTLPIRPHVKINAKGVADKDNNALFFNEVVYKEVSV